ncbi:MAG: PspA/IM30 family protein [Alistipes sp.]|nr:PspA/IM30 family protein [Alistipes sp.]
MGILARFKDIMSSNINALLDKMEDPEKMIDQYLRNLQEDLGKVKAETAAVMAEETRAKRELDECVKEVEKMQSYAQKAVLAGNDNDAKVFLEKKQQLAAKQASLEIAYTGAAENAAKMRQMHDKLVTDINELVARRDSIKAKVKVAKTTERVNKMTSSISGSEADLAAFDRMEAKANRMLDQANAMTELNTKNPGNSIENMQAKYDTAPSTAVDDELAALKAELGIQQ